MPKSTNREHFSSSFKNGKFFRCKYLKEKCIRERIASMIILMSHALPYCAGDVIFLARLRGKFDIDSWSERGKK